MECGAEGGGANGRAGGRANGRAGGRGKWEGPPPPPPPNLWRALEHPEHRRLRAYGEEHEDGEHGARGDVVAIEEA